MLRLSLYVGCLLQCDKVYKRLFECIAMFFSGHYYVGCIMQCSLVAITKFDVHNSVLCFSLLC